MGQPETAFRSRSIEHDTGNSDPAAVGQGRKSLLILAVDVEDDERRATCMVLVRLLEQ